MPGRKLGRRTQRFYCQSHALPQSSGRCDEAVRCVGSYGNRSSELDGPTLGRRPQSRAHVGSGYVTTCHAAALVCSLTRSRSVAAVSAMKSELVSVDLKRVQSNIVYLKIDCDTMSLAQFCDRMRKVSRVICLTHVLVVHVLSTSDASSPFVTSFRSRRKKSQNWAKKQSWSG